MSRLHHARRFSVDGQTLQKEYATKRYRSNLINWGMLPFVIDKDFDFDNDDYVFIQESRML